MHPSGLLKEGCFKALSLVKLQPSFTCNLCSTLTDSDIAVHSSYDCKGLCHCYTFSAYYANLFYIHYKYTFLFGLQENIIYILMLLYLRKPESMKTG